MPIDILLVEDSEGDVKLMREVLFETNPGARLHVVRDGTEAMDFLTYQGQYLKAPRPSLILLDLNLPKIHGHEVLTRIKSNPHLAPIPIIVLSGSDAESDVVTSYRLSASCYLRKPEELKAFEGLIKSINVFWLTSVKRPGNRRAMGPL